MHEQIKRMLLFVVKLFARRTVARREDARPIYNDLLLCQGLLDCAAILLA